MTSKETKAISQARQTAISGYGHIHKRMNASSVSGQGDQDKFQPSSASTKDEQVHPSWVAKQRMKNAQMSATPQGTKTVFD